MEELKTNYENALLDSSKNENRVFNIVDNNGKVVYENVSLEDVSVYTKEGTHFGANDINSTNTAVNELNSNLADVESKIANLSLNHFFIDESKVLVSRTDVTETGNVTYTAKEDCLFACVMSAYGMTRYCSVYLGNDDNEVFRLQTDNFVLAPFSLYLKKEQTIIINYRYISTGYFPWYKVYALL